MPYIDPDARRANQQERSRRYRERLKVAKYGPDAAGHLDFKEKANGSRKETSPVQGS